MRQKRHPIDMGATVHNKRIQYELTQDRELRVYQMCEASSQNLESYHVPSPIGSKTCCHIQGDGPVVSKPGVRQPNLPSGVA